MKVKNMKSKKLISASICILTFCAIGFGYYIHNHSIATDSLSLSPDNSSNEDLLSSSTEKKSPYDLSFAVFGDVHDNEPDFQEIIKYAEKLEYNDKAKAYKVTYEDGENVHEQSTDTAKDE